MNHQQFENWLLAEEKLNPAQEKALTKHLETCAACQELASAWGQVKFTFQQTEVAAPQAGFTARWEQTLAADEYRRGGWRGWLVMSFGAVFLAMLLLAPAAAAIASPTELVAKLVDGFSNSIAYIGALWTAVESLGRLLPQVPLAIWLSVINFSLVMLVTTWLIAIKQFAYKQGVQK